MLHSMSLEPRPNPYRDETMRHEGKMKHVKKAKAKRPVVARGPEHSGDQDKSRKQRPPAVAGASDQHDQSAAKLAGVDAGQAAAVANQPDDRRDNGSVEPAGSVGKDAEAGANDQPNGRFMTGLGEALAEQNVKTVAALKAAGHRVIDFGPLIGKPLTPAQIRKSAAIHPSPFGNDAKVSETHAKMGALVVGADVARPIQWPDMAAVAEKAKAARPPMSEEAKAKLREYADTHPKDVGDQVAIWLRGLDLEGVYVKGAEYLGEKLDVLKAKYAKLNPGQQRMTIGNRMRAKWKKENLSAGTREAAPKPEPKAVKS